MGFVATVLFAPLLGGGRVWRGEAVEVEGYGPYGPEEFDKTQVTWHSCLHFAVFNVF